MGLFGFLGKVAKAGLGIVTHGASDKIINGARAIIGGKPKVANMVPYAGTTTAQEAALANKIGTLTPRARITERTEGWGFKSKAAYKRKRRRAPKLAVSQGYTPAQQRAANKAFDKMVRPKRKLPSGGLDLAKMAVAWKAAGKPIPWQSWIKTQPIRKA